jgi:hypothetical protein
VLGTDYVFKERDGIHVTGSTNDSSTYKRAATIVLKALEKGHEFLENKREDLEKSKTIVSWDEVSRKWPNAF